MKNVLKSQLEEYKRTNSKKSMNKMQSSIDTISETYGSNMISSATEGSSSALSSSIAAAETALNRSTRNKSEIAQSVQNIIANME